MATASVAGETPECYTDMPDYEAKFTAIFEAFWARLEHWARLNKLSTCWSNKKPKQHSRQHLTHKQHRAPRWHRRRRDPLPAVKIRGIKHRSTATECWGPLMHPVAIPTLLPGREPTRG
ncbi:Hypothetical predicted protein, partial [Pelobates cultripes]